MNKMVASRIVVTLLVTLSCVYFSACRKADSTQETGIHADEGLPTVVIVNLARGEVKQSLMLPGSLEPYEKAALYAKVTGFLEKVYVDIGDVIKRGDVLAQLTVPEMLSELKRAEADVVKANANAELAAVTYKRLADLQTLEPGAITQQDVDLASAQLGIARAEVQVSEATVTRFRTLLSYTTIRAPFAGTVKRRFADTGMLITAGATNSEPIVEVVRTDKLRLVIYIPESLAPYVRRGQKVLFTLDAFPGESFERTVSRIAGALMEDTRNMRVEIDIDNASGKFLPGMYATVHLAFKDISDALTIPATAVQVKEGKTCICTVEDGAIHWIPVTILQDDGAEVVVAGELRPGAAVVVAGPTLLEEGQKVQMRKEGETK